ncbi:MAG TPA: response regulator [Opitutaceae bacterium]|jgi:CheY-like chemotaxis protein|nr:response regulator [Opitutaceae bacterium]
MDKPKEIAATAKRILVIDDQHLIRDLLTQLLEAEGHHVMVAASGREGLVVARVLPFNLILLDVDMPGLNGLEVCTELKRGAETAHVPVIFISGRRSTPEIQQMTAVGAAGFLPKPFLFEQVRRTVNRILEATGAQP